MGLFSSPEEKQRKKEAKLRANYEYWKQNYHLEDISPELDEQIFKIFSLNNNLDFGALVNTVTHDEIGTIRDIAQVGREIASQNFVLMKQNDEIIKLLKDKK